MQEKDKNTKGQLYPFTEGEKKCIAEEEKKLGHRLEEIPNVAPDGMCFGCGTLNPVGLHMRFFFLSDGSISFFTIPNRYQSYHGRMHGGLVATLLDETIGNYLWAKHGYPFYTARMDIRYKLPVNIGDTVKIECHLVKEKMNLYIMKGEVVRPDGKIAAEATSYMMGEK